jgi:hypothetical protein
MPETYQTGLPALPTVTLSRRRDVMGHPAVRRARHALVRPLRAAGEPRGGYLVTGADGAELGILVCVELGRKPAFAVVPVEGSGPPARVEGRLAAAGVLALYVVQRGLRAARDEAEREAREERERARRLLDPFDRDALATLTPWGFRPT